MRVCLLLIISARIVASTGVVVNVMIASVLNVAPPISMWMLTEHVCIVKTCALLALIRVVASVILVELVFLKKYVIPAANRNMVICVVNVLTKIALNVRTTITSLIISLSVKNVKKVVFNVRTTQDYVKNAIRKTTACHWTKEYVIIAVNIMVVCNVIAKIARNVTISITLWMGKVIVSLVKPIA